jgi:CheY-like chemotaxis protein
MIGAEDAGAASGRAGAPARPLSGRRVLLAEDQPEALAALAATLESLGARVRPECAPDAAADALSAAPGAWDLLVTDFEMPEMTGAELAARARTVAPGLAIVCLTGLGPEDPRVAGASGLFDAVARKPAPRATLAEAALAALDMAGRRR